MEFLEKRDWDAWFQKIKKQHNPLSFFGKEGSESAWLKAMKALSESCFAYKNIGSASSYHSLKQAKMINDTA